MTLGNNAPAGRFVTLGQEEIEQLPNHVRYWHLKPGLVQDTNLLFVRAHFPPGQAHQFHHHPHMEEIIFILKGRGEEWLEKEKRILGPGDSIYIPAGMVHATYNIGEETLEFLAILTPAKSAQPDTVDVSAEEPWRSLRPWP
ncbi:MAG TPA: cupin domain-containing protein [Methylomirabilota bacterium]|nr:cupin domain-containing protein [Methylomirabilota bacterium]